MRSIQYDVVTLDGITVTGREDRGPVAGSVVVYPGHPGSYYDPAEDPEVLDFHLTYADGSDVDASPLTDEQCEALCEALLGAVYARRVEAADER